MLSLAAPRSHPRPHLRQGHFITVLLISHPRAKTTTTGRRPLSRTQTPPTRPTWPAPTAAPTPAPTPPSRDADRHWTASPALPWQPVVESFSPAHTDETPSYGANHLIVGYFDIFLCRVKLIESFSQKSLSTRFKNETVHCIFCWINWIMSKA